MFFSNNLTGLMTFKSLLTPQISVVKNSVVESIHELGLFLEMTPVDHNNTIQINPTPKNSSLNKDFTRTISNYSYVKLIPFEAAPHSSDVALA
jgi:hypothetical protein